MVKSVSNSEVVRLTAYRYAKYFNMERDDLLQECWLSILTQPNQIPYVVSRIACINAFRKLIRWRRHNNFISHKSYIVEPINPEILDIPDLLILLTPRQYEIIRLTYWEGMNAKEIGIKLKISWTTAARIKMDAITRIRKKYK